MLSFFPRGVLDEILNLIESVSEDFPSYSFIPSYLPYFVCLAMFSLAENQFIRVRIPVRGLQSPLKLYISSLIPQLDIAGMTVIIYGAFNDVGHSLFLTVSHTIFVKAFLWPACRVP